MHTTRRKERLAMGSRTKRKFNTKKGKAARARTVLSERLERRRREGFQVY